MTEESKTIALLLRDYGALGILLALLVLVVVRLWAELRQVRNDSDDRAKRHLDQIEELIKKNAEASTAHAKVFADATVKQSEIFATAVRELTQTQRELTHKLLDLADNKLQRRAPIGGVSSRDGAAIPPPSSSPGPRAS